MKKIMLYIIFFSFIFSYFLVVIVSHKVNPDVLKYSEAEAERFSVVVINTSVAEVIENNDLSDILDISRNNNMEIEEVNFNTNKVNSFLKEVTEVVSKYLIEIEEGNTKNINISDSLRGSSFKYLKHGVISEMPMGSVFGNSLLANTGPIIPVKLTFIGKVYSSINTNVKAYGINNSYVEVDVRVEVTFRVSLPSLSKDKKVVKDIPIMMRIIQGKIPEYYGGLADPLYKYNLELDKNTLS